MLKPTSVNLITQTVNHTFLIQNFINFPEFGVEFDNINSPEGDVDITTCEWDPDNDPTCPVFKISTILEQVLCFTWYLGR